MTKTEFLSISENDTVTTFLEATNFNLKHGNYLIISIFP